MASNSNQPAEGVHFVVRRDGKFHITDDSHVYDPLAPNLTADDEAAIKFLNEILGGSDVALLDNSMLVQIPDNGIEFVAPPYITPDS